MVGQPVSTALRTAILVFTVLFLLMFAVFPIAERVLSGSYVSNIKINIINLFLLFTLFLFALAVDGNAFTM